jgi:hypothetical protein
MISKLYNKYIDLFKKYENNSIEYEKNNALKKQKNLKKEENLKNNIMSITNENIDKFSSMCYNNNTNDLKEELKILKMKSNKMNSYDVLIEAFQILEKLLLRTSSFKDEKELEIENLNGKIIYLLSELDIYKKHISNSNSNNNNNKNNELQLINNQIELKDDEINRLNKDIEDYLIKIKELTCENNLLKNRKDNATDNINNFNINKNNINNNNSIDNKIYQKLKTLNNQNDNKIDSIYSNQNKKPKKNENNNKYMINNKNNYNNNNINYNINNKYNNLNMDKNNKDKNNDSDNDSYKINNNEKYSINENNNDNVNEDDNYMSDEEIENYLAQNQNDIDKIESQLRELNEKQNESIFHQ